MFCFLVGILFTTEAGEYWLTIVDTYGATGLTLIAFIEVIIVMYVYGHEKFTQVSSNKNLLVLSESYQTWSLFVLQLSLLNKL